MNNQQDGSRNLSGDTLGKLVGITEFNKLKNSKGLLELIVECIGTKKCDAKYFRNNKSIKELIDKMKKDDQELFFDWLLTNQNIGFICKLIGNMYETVYKDEISELIFMYKASTLGDGHGIFNIGKKYDNNKKYTDAMKWYINAENMGVTMVYYKLGLLYLYGHGVEKNIHNALDYFRKGEDAGCSYAINSIGRLYYKGEKLDQDSKIALKYFEKSARLGNERGFYNSGIIHEENGNKYDALINYGKGLHICNTESIKVSYETKIKKILKDGDIGITLLLKYVEKELDNDNITKDFEELKRDLNFASPEKPQISL
jgi:TPR repeat protein